MIGNKLGIYEIREELGRGGMGTVYKAYDASLDRHVAIKVLPAGLASDHSIVKRFAREARALAKVRHPNLMHVYAVGEEDGCNYFAMELIDGQTLSAVLKKKTRLSVKESIKILGQVMAGLSKVHKAGMVHRDVKPSNIMIDSDGRAVLMDFGLAKGHTDHDITMDGHIVGTPDYMSPEQAEGTDIDARSDIYSLGCVMYHMLTGKPPYSGKSTVSIIKQHLDTPPKRPRELVEALPAKIDAIILKAMEKSPRQRYQNVKEIAMDMVKVVKSPSLLSLIKQTDKETSAETQVAPIVASLVRKPAKAWIARSVWVILGIATIVFLALVVHYALSRPPEPMVRVELVDGTTAEGQLSYIGDGKMILIDRHGEEVSVSTSEVREINFEAHRE